MSRKRMTKCLALCALALAVCVGIAAALVISKNRRLPAPPVKPPRQPVRRKNA